MSTFCNLAAGTHLQSNTPTVFHPLSSTSLQIPYVHSLSISVSSSELLINTTTKSLNELSKHSSVNIHWIPGHSGSLGYEKADELIKQGSSSYPQDPYLSLKRTIPPSHQL